MFAPLLALALFGQGSIAPSPFIGTWEGTLTYVANDQAKVVIINELAISSELEVVGRHVITDFNNQKLVGALTNGKIRKEKLEELMFRPKDGAEAYARMDGPIEVVTIDGQLLLRSKLGLKPGKGFIYRHFGHRGTTDDASYDAVLELHRKPDKGATAPSFFTPQT